jgi:uncharacterized protein YbaP (TraB family)
MKKSLCYSVLSALIVLFAGAVQAQRKSYPNTLLWRITGNKLEKPSYLFGTMHLEDRRLFMFGDSLYSCLERAEGFAMEINPDSAMIAMFKAMNEPDTTGLLKDVLTKKELDRLSKPLQKKYGISADKITRKQAWMYSYDRMKTKKPDDMETAVDTYLYNLAKRQGKWVGGIEDIEDQLDLVEELGAGFDAQGMLADGGGKKQVDKLIQIYLAQDLNAITDWIGSMEDETRDEMLIRRNIKMAYRMDSMAHVRSNFFAVGAAHLPGKDGLIELLEGQGFTVEPIFASKKISPETYTYESVALPWFKVEDKDKTYTVEMPGKPYPLEVKGGMTMETYADMGSGLIYLVSSVKSGKRSVDPDSILAGVAKNISGSSKVNSKRSISLNGVPGLEAVVTNESHFYRLQCFVKGSIVYLVMTGATKKQLLSTGEANRFYQSLVMQDVVDKEPAKNHGWRQFTMEDHGLQIELPGEPKRNYKLEENFRSNPAVANWTARCYTFSDVGTDIYYMLFVRAPKPGYHVLNDTTLFAESRRNIESSFADTVFLYELFNLQGYPAMRLNAGYKKNEFVMESIQVNRGDRCYTLIAIGNENNDNGKDFNRYLNSFKLRDYKRAEWRHEHSPGNAFKTWVPAPISTLADEEKEKDEEALESGILLSYDSLSGYSYLIEKELISPYYWTDSDSSFFESYASRYIGWQDSVIEKRAVQNGTARGMEYFVKSPVISNIKRLRLLPYGDTLFVVYSMIPAADVKSTDPNKFFSEFRFVHDVPDHKYLDNKTSKLLTDLLSGDSATFFAASASIESAPFTVTDLPSLHRAMLYKYQDFDEGVQCAHDKILSVVAGLKHASTVDFIGKNYHHLTGENEQLKYPFLSVLARIHTVDSYKLFLRLSLEQTPARGNGRLLQYYLRDSLLLTASLFPDILKLSGDSNFIKALPFMLNQLLDSNLVSINDVKIYANNFNEYAERELKRINASETYDHFSYSLIDLLGKINQPRSNQLLQGFVKAGTLYIKEAAAIALIKNDQAVNPVELNKIAADKSYRSGFYAQLYKAGKVKLFPSKYASQKSIAESDIYVIAADDYEPASIQFVGERTIGYKGVKQKFLLFKVVYNYEDSDPESFLAIAGPYPLSGKIVVADAELTGLYTDEPFDIKKAGQHLKIYIERQEKYTGENEPD